MNDYNKNTFWTCKNEETQELKYYMKINNTYVEVDKEVYAVCFNSYRKTLRDNAQELKYGLISLDQENENGDRLINHIQGSDVLEDLAYQNIILEQIERIISSLNETDRYIVKSILFDDRSERDIAKELNLTKDIVRYRKVKFIEKIKKVFHQF